MAWMALLDGAAQPTTAPAAERRDRAREVCFIAGARRLCLVEEDDLWGQKRHTLRRHDTDCKKWTLNLHIPSKAPKSLIRFIEQELKQGRLTERPLCMNLMNGWSQPFSVDPGTQHGAIRPLDDLRELPTSEMPPEFALIFAKDGNFKIGVWACHLLEE